MIFFIQNNRFAISVPVAEQLAGESVFGMVEGYEAPPVRRRWLRLRRDL